MEVEDKNMNPKDDGNPKFGRLLVVLFLVVVFAGVLTWIMQSYFPHFGMS